MYARGSRHTHRRRSRLGVVAPLVVLLATTLAATPQQDTATGARAARARARFDGAAARIRAMQVPPSQTSDGPPQGRPFVAMPKLIGLDTLSAIRVMRSREMLDRRSLA